MVICAVGIPLPVQSHTMPTQDSSEPYPCMDCLCGCKDAETCWRNCCCYSNEEKLAWARDKGITPPAYVVSAVRLAKSQSGCCSKAGCCRSSSACSPPKVVNSCCSKSENRRCCQTRERRTARNTVLALQAVRCQGLKLSLSSLPPTLVAADVDPPELMPLAGSIVARNDELLDDPYYIPDTPPPQC